MNAKDPTWVLSRLAEAQSDGRSPYFAAGLFPAFRTLPQLGYLRPDDNLFFTCLVLLGLRRLQPSLPESLHRSIALISQRAFDRFDDYRSPGSVSYNFYRKTPGGHFPYGKLLHRLQKFRLPDDADVTALAMLARPHRQEAAHAFLELLTEKSERKRGQKIRFDLDPGFDPTETYTTWLGSAHMPLEYSFCVWCNIVDFIQTYQLPRSKRYAATIEAINLSCTKNFVLTHPYEISAYYPTFPLIAYHLSRLLAEHSLPELDPARVKMHEMLQNFRVNSLFDRLLLAITKLRFGLSVSEPNLLSEESLNDSPFFVASFLNYSSFSYFRRLGRRSTTHLTYICPTYNLLLLCEYQTLLRALR